MEALIYSLCSITSFFCACLLFRAYSKSKMPLLLWTAICFAGFTLNNFLLVVDLVLLPTAIDLLILRTIPACLGLAVLGYGLTKDSI
jgi:hypothetical protein